MRPVIILSGPVGAGKTTIGRKLIEMLPSPVAYIEGDLFWSFFVNTDNKQGRYKKFKTIMVSMIAAAIPFARDEYSVILDFSIPPWFLEAAQKIARVKEVPLDYVVICPSEKICAERAAGRKEGRITDYAPYHDLYLDFEKAQDYIIAGDESDAAVVAERIAKGLATSRFRLK